jgi:hypothetical protein
MAEGTLVANLPAPPEAGRVEDLRHIPPPASMTLVYSLI